MESGMDFDREALEYQARTTALINAVVAKDKKEREATNRKAAEEKRKEAAAKRQAGVKFKCAHGRQRSLCKDCGGSGVCEHGRRRDQCKDCGGGSMCEHGRERRRCKDCRFARAAADAQEKAAAALEKAQRPRSALRPHWRARRQRQRQRLHRRRRRSVACVPLCAFVST